MKRFFEPTKGGNRAAERRAQERHEMEMALMKQQKEILDKYFSIISPIAEPILHGVLRNQGIDPKTGRYQMSSATLMRLGETSEALRRAEAESAALLAAQGVDPQTIAKMQANMRTQSAMDLANKAMQERQNAYAQAQNLITGIFGMGGQVRTVQDIQVPSQNPFNPLNAVANIINSYTTYDLMRRQQRALQQQQAQSQSRLVSTPRGVELQTPQGTLNINSAVRGFMSMGTY